MAERFQYYVLGHKTTEDGTLDEREEDIIVAIHDQWAYGPMAVKYVNNLIKHLQKFNTRYLWNNEMATFVESILKIGCDDGGEYLKRISLEDMFYTPDGADSNHGCVIIDARDQSDIKASFYDVDGIYQPIREWDKEYYDGDSFDDTMKEWEIDIVENVYDRLDQDFYKWLCGEMTRRGLEGYDKYGHKARLEGYGVDKTRKPKILLQMALQRKCWDQKEYGKIAQPPRMSEDDYDIFECYVDNAQQFYIVGDIEAFDMFVEERVRENIASQSMLTVIKHTDFHADDLPTLQKIANDYPVHFQQLMEDAVEWMPTLVGELIPKYETVFHDEGVRVDLDDDLVAFKYDPQKFVEKEE